MYFQYMASNAPFRDQEDTNLISVRMRDAEALGYKLPDWCTPDFYTHEHNKNQRIWLKKDESNNATFKVHSFDRDDAAILEGTEKTYFASLKWIDTEEKAEALYLVGTYYEYGWGGVKKDCQKAYHFYEMAEKKGDKRAKKKMSSKGVKNLRDAIREILKL